MGGGSFLKAKVKNFSFSYEANFARKYVNITYRRF